MNSLPYYLQATLRFILLFSLTIILYSLDGGFVFILGSLWNALLVVTCGSIALYGRPKTAHSVLHAALAGFLVAISLYGVHASEVFTAQPNAKAFQYATQYILNTLYIAVLFYVACLPSRKG